MNKILVLGSGELGHEIITSLSQHPQITTSTHSITLTVRPSTLSNPSPSRKSQLDTYKSQLHITILPLDIESTPFETLVKTFSEYTTIIHAGGMTLSPGTQLTITQAVLSTQPRVNLYIPWQFGVDYDLIGPEAGDGLFAEQHQIRRLLRSQRDVHWLIVSNGIFMSFLFEEFWGVFSRQTNNDKEVTEVTVTALGNWSHRLTVTTAEDIGKCTAELVLVDTHLRDRPVMIAGDSLTYDELAEIVSRVVTPMEIQRKLQTTDDLIKASRRDPGNKLLQYRVVFSQDVGLDWNSHEYEGKGVEIYNVQKGMKMVGVEEWLTDHEEVWK